MDSEPQSEYTRAKTGPISRPGLRRLKIIGLLLTLAGIGLFSYFIYIEGFHFIVRDVQRFGFFGFGGSDMIMLFEQGRIEFLAKEKTHYKQGEQIARAINTR